MAPSTMNIATHEIPPKRRRRSHLPISNLVPLTALLLNTSSTAQAQCNPCANKPSGFAVVPFTGCTQYVGCQNGQTSGFNQNCNAGLIFDENILGCNWDYQVTCAPDPDPITCGEVGVGADGVAVGGTGSGGGGASSGQADCNTPICSVGQNGRVVVPFTNCNQFVQCSNGKAGTPETCPQGQAYSPQIQACNVQSMVSCPPDPTCPPVTVKNPTLAPTYTEVSPEPTTEEEFEEMAPSPNSPAVMGKVEGTPMSVSFITPDLLEGVYVMDAHLDANKILIMRELFNGGRPLTPTSSTFDYNSFKDSLHTMITTPIDNTSFYIGTSDHSNGRVYGLVNIAAFLSQAVVDSIQYGSCDEINIDNKSGVLPLSNACGQNGLDYQEASTLCFGSEEKYACNVQWDMRSQGERVGSSPPPFFCGPAKDYGGFTGYWDHESGSEIKEEPTPNGSGKTDVQGCCWWGRGVVHSRGICQYGKLNYFLGKKAAEDSRPAMFPDVDFCLDPGAVCSNQSYPNMKWITGLFRWIMDVQTYNVEDFYYIDQLIRFVEGGFEDWSFIHRVSGIVSQGCHKPPCVEGAEFDSTLRRDMFVKTLKLFGLRVNASSESSRRLSDSE